MNKGVCTTHNHPWVRQHELTALEVKCTDSLIEFEVISSDVKESDKQTDHCIQTWFCDQEVPAAHEQMLYKDALLLQGSAFYTKLMVDASTGVDERTIVMMVCCQQVTEGETCK